MRVYDVPVTLSDGKLRTLRFTLGTMRRLKSIGLDLLQLPEDQMLDHLADLLWAALAWEDKSLTPESVADLIPLAQTAEIMAKVTDALLKANTPETPSPDPTTPAPSQAMPAMT